MADTMSIKIEDDGTISIKTDAISPANHKSADDFLDTLEDMCGGGRDTEKRKQKHVHIHKGQKIVHAH